MMRGEVARKRSDRPTLGARDRESLFARTDPRLTHLLALRSSAALRPKISRSMPIERANALFQSFWAIEEPSARYM